MEFVLIKEPRVHSRTKINGIKLDEIYIRQLKELVEKKLNQPSQSFELVFGGRVMKQNKTPAEYRIVSGTTIHVLKKRIEIPAIEITEKLKVSPEFIEVLRHERMQDLVVRILLDPLLQQWLLVDNEVYASITAKVKTLLRSRYFLGLLQTSTFEVFNESTELIALGQRMLDKFLVDLKSYGRTVPNSDAELITVLERSLFVDHYSTEGETQQETQQSGTVDEIAGEIVPVREEANMEIVVTGEQASSSSTGQSRPQVGSLFTADMLMDALHGSSTSSPVTNPPSYSAEQSTTNRPSLFTTEEISQAMANVTNPLPSPSHREHHHQRSHHHHQQRSAHTRDAVTGRRSDSSSELGPSRRSERHSHRRETQMAPSRSHTEQQLNSEFSPRRAAHLMQAYQLQLEKLKLMGITDDLLAVQVLQATGGDLQSALEILLQSN